MIKRYRPDSPLVKPIGIVAPSRGAERNAARLQQTANNLLNSAYANAVDEQRAIGQDYAVKLAVRNEDQQIEYQEIPDSMSPIARRSAQSQVDQRYQTALRSDLLEKSKAFRVNQDGSPATLKEYEDNMLTYVNKTKELNTRYANFVEEYSLPLMAQNMTDIRSKTYQAAMKQDFINMQGQINGMIADLGATTSSMAGQQQLAVDEMGNSIVAEDVMYEQIMRNIDEFEDTHGSRIEGAMVRNMRNSAKLNYYNGQVKRIAGRVSTVVSRELQNPRAKFNAEKAIINDMISSLQSTESYDAIPPARRNQLAQLGFTREFIENPDMLYQRKQIASELATYEGTRSEQFQNDQIALKNDQIAYNLNEGGFVGQKDLDGFVEQYGITDGYSAISQIKNIMTASEFDPIRRGLQGDSPLPTAVQEIFENPDILMLAASQGQLGDVLALYNNVTTKFDAAGRSFTTPRGISAKGVAQMEALAAYSSVMQTMDINEFFAKSREFVTFGADEQMSRVKGMLGGLYNGNVNTFVEKSTGISTPEELGELSAIAPTLIYTHGVEQARSILKNTANKLYKPSNLLYGTEGASMWSPEARYGSEFPIFRMSADKALSQVAGNYSIGKNAKLIYDRRGGAGFPVYIAVDSDTGIPIMDGNGEMIRVGGMAVLADRQMKNREAVQLYQSFLDAEQERYAERLSNLPTDEEAAQTRFP